MSSEFQIDCNSILRFLSYHLKDIELFFVFPVVYRKNNDYLWMYINLLDIGWTQRWKRDLESNLEPFDHDEVMEFELFDEHKNTSVINTKILNLW